MTDKEKNKNKSKTSNKSKTVSTFSKMREKEIENQKKQIKAIFGSTHGLFDHLNLIRTIENDQRLLGLPSEQELERIAKLAENIPTGLEKFIRIKKSIPDYLIEELEKSILILDSQRMFESMLSIDRDEIKKLEGMLMGLQIHDIQKSLDEYKTLNVDIKEFKQVKSAYNEFILNTRTMESIEIGNIKFKTVQNTQLQVESLKGDLKEIKETIIQDAKKKDTMLEELLDYFKKGGSNTVKVKKVKYNKKTSELMIDDKTINIKADTNQHYLCKILFANKSNMTKIWEAYDIFEAMGEYAEVHDDWLNKIYNTVRHLNEKIKSRTGIDKFILYDSKTVLVNPKYTKFS